MENQGGNNVHFNPKIEFLYLRGVILGDGSRNVPDISGYAR